MFGKEMKSVAIWISAEAASAVANRINAKSKNVVASVYEATQGHKVVTIDNASGVSSFITMGTVYALCEAGSTVSGDPWEAFPFIDPAPRNVTGPSIIND